MTSENSMKAPSQSKRINIWKDPFKLYESMWRHFETQKEKKGLFSFTESWKAIIRNDTRDLVTIELEAFRSTHGFKEESQIQLVRYQHDGSTSTCQSYQNSFSLEHFRKNPHWADQLLGFISSKARGHIEMRNRSTSWSFFLPKQQPIHWNSTEPTILRKNGILRHFYNQTNPILAESFELTTEKELIQWSSPTVLFSHEFGQKRPHTKLAAIGNFKNDPSTGANESHSCSLRFETAVLSTGLDFPILSYIEIAGEQINLKGQSLWTTLRAKHELHYPEWKVKIDLQGYELIIQLNVEHKDCFTYPLENVNGSGQFRTACPFASGEIQIYKRGKLIKVLKAQKSLWLEFDSGTRNTSAQRLI